MWNIVLFLLHFILVLAIIKQLSIDVDVNCNSQLVLMPQFKNFLLFDNIADKHMNHANFRYNRN